jgi:hypothetical protein
MDLISEDGKNAGYLTGIAARRAYLKEYLSQVK